MATKYTVILSPSERAWLEEITHNRKLRALKNRSSALTKKLRIQQHNDDSKKWFDI
jgi:hypothetical protein